MKAVANTDSQLILEVDTTKGRRAYLILNTHSGPQHAFDAMSPDDQGPNAAKPINEWLDRYSSKA